MSHIERTAAVAARRLAAVNEIISTSGLLGVLRLAARTRPDLVGMTLADATADESIDEFIAWLGQGETSNSIASSFWACRARVRGLPWVVSLLDRYPALSAVVQGHLLACLTDFEAASIEAERREPEAEREFWLRFSYYGHDEESALLSKIARKLCDGGRYTAALERLSYHLSDEAALPNLVETIATVFENLLVSIPDERVGGTLGENHLTQLLSFIGRHAAEIGEARVARIELNFLSHLRLEVPTMALHRTLSTSPEFFVEIVSLRCRRRQGEADDTPEELDPTRALTAYRLLDSWALPPGTDSDGTTDAKSCGDWIEAAKELLQKADRFTPCVAPQSREDPGECRQILGGTRTRRGRRIRTAASGPRILR